MANRLLSSGGLDREKESRRAAALKESNMTEHTYRSVVYRGGDSMVVEGVAAYRKAIASGWADRPGGAPEESAEVDEDLFMTPAEATHRLMSELNEEVHSLRNQLVEAVSAVETLKLQNQDLSAALMDANDELRRLRELSSGAKDNVPKPPQGVQAPPRRKPGSRKRSEA